MPYPFAPLPTFAELRAILEQEFGCEFKKDDSIIVELGDSYPVTYFERDMGGEVLTCVVVAPKDKRQRIELDFLRSIVERLQLDPARFGLDLDSFDR